jgi:hypothetical protein
MPVLVKHKRNGDYQDFQQPQERALPVWSESIPDRWSSQRKCTACNCASQNIARHRRGGIHPITTSDIVGPVDECCCCACSKWNTREDRPNVVHIWCTRPGKHQPANRHQDCTDTNDEYWRLGCWFTIGVQLLSLNHFPQKRFARNHQHIADSDTKVREAGMTCRPPTKPYKHSWINHERQVCPRISMFQRHNTRLYSQFIA